MPLSFASVGDIISVCLLVKDLVEALDKVRGSKAEYQSLTRELWILDRVLLEIDLLARTHGGGTYPELDALCQTARKAVDRCKELVSDFLTRIKQYQSSFSENDDKKTNFFRDAAMKVRWRVGEKHALDKFRVEIAGTSSSLQMLLATASVKLMGINEKRVKGQITSFQTQNETKLARQDAILLTIQKRVEDTNRLITAGDSVAAKLANALRLDWLRQLGAELKDFMRRIIAINIATYHAIMSIQSALPNHLERGLIEEPFILEDAIGRVAPVHLQFVTSWDAFNTVLKIRFKDRQGFVKVKEKQYGLQDKATVRDIEQSRPWQRAFLPGQRVEMSFIFNSEEPNHPNLQDTNCPGCQAPSKNSTEADTECKNCRMWFRRITVIENVEPPPQEPVPAPWKTKPEFGQTGFAAIVFGPARPGKRRLALDKIEGDDDLREFKRIRLITKRQRTKPRTFWKAGKSTFVSFFSLPKTSEVQAISTPTTEQLSECSDLEETQQILLDPAIIIRQDLEMASRSGSFHSQITRRQDISSEGLSMKLLELQTEFMGYLGENLEIGWDDSHNLEEEDYIPSRDYLNGRRYNGYHSGRVFLPIDEDEKERLGCLHFLFLFILEGKLYSAPISHSPLRVLDISTGSGMWAVDFGDNYPNSKVFGTVLSSIQPQCVSPNVEFEIEDAEEEWLFFETELFDFIHGRCLSGSVDDWDRLCAQAYKNLQPGGWVEFQELEELFLSDDDTMQKAEHLREWQELLNTAANKMHREIRVADKLKQRLLSAGFVDVHEKIIKLPIGPWSTDPKMREISCTHRYTVCRYIEPYTCRYLGRVIGWSKQECRDLAAKVQSNVLDRNKHFYVRYFFVCGRKPQN